MDKCGNGEKTIENNTIRVVKNYIQEHYAEELSLGTLAEIAYMNPYYFSAFSKKKQDKILKIIWQKYE